jgi:hypothetical protein
MKTIISLIALLGSLAITNAENGYYSSSCEPVSYNTPVVYQSPVVYQAPVAYYAPVYYMASAANAAICASVPRSCYSPSTVIHIGGKGGNYITSNRGYSCNSGSTVIYIGSRYARH